MNINKENNSEKRQCYKCKEVKELKPANFHRNKNRLLGFEYKCKVCEKTRTAKKTKKYADLTQEQKLIRRRADRKYAKTLKGRAIFIVAAYRKSDRIKGYDHDIDINYVMEQLLKPCVYCGFHSTGLDRILNNLGHTIKNTVPACGSCNCARMDNFTHEEMLVIGKTIRKVKLDRIL